VATAAPQRGRAEATSSGRRVTGLSMLLVVTIHSRPVSPLEVMVINVLSMTASLLRCWAPARPVQGCEPSFTYGRRTAPHACRQRRGGPRKSDGPQLR